MAELDDYLTANADRFEEELCDFLRIPSVSADSKHQADVNNAAAWVARQLTGMGLKTEIALGSGHPIVYGEWLGAGPGKPTVLIYGHYDVQPPDPLDLWETGPFEPTIRVVNGMRNIYARGATDDKGQVLTHLKAIEAWMSTQGAAPVNLKVLIEGEEEVGSGYLGEYLPENADKLACDHVLISDSCMLGPDKPAITYGLRGIAYFEVFARGPKRDLHSGTFGGSVANPVNALAKLVGSLVDDNGRITVPGFYEDVVELTAADRQELARLPFDDRQYAAELGVRELFGEAGYTTLERRWARPTCDANGIGGGYQGEGAKTVLPAKAAAKVSFRLVPNQDPHKVGEAFRKHLDSLCPPGIELEVVDHHGAGAVLVPLNSPGLKAAATALERAFGTKPYFIREGGSIPIVLAFKRHLGADALLLGYGLDDDNTHSPNEKFCLKDFHRGIRTNVYLLQELANLGRN